jgi:hypothetical protein
MSNRSSSRASRTDWPRVDALRDEDIDLSEIPEVTRERFRKAIVRRGLKPDVDKAQVHRPK